MRYVFGMFMALALIAIALVLDPDPRTPVPLTTLVCLGFVWLTALTQFVCCALWALGRLLAPAPRLATFHDVRRR